MFAVGGLQTKSQAGACASDRSTLETALESYRASHGAYGTEAQLVADGQLRHESTMYDVSLAGGDFTLTPIGACDGVDLIAAPAGAAAASPGADVAAPTTTTTEAPAQTTTTTEAPTTTTTAPLVNLSLSSVCTPPSHWPSERAWSVANPNSADVDFTLDATRATGRPGSHVAGAATPGTSTWYLPVASHGSKNTAVLDALGHRRSLNSTNRRC